MYQSMIDCFDYMQCKYNLGILLMKPLLSETTFKSTKMWPLHPSTVVCKKTREGSFIDSLVELLKPLQFLLPVAD